MNPAGTGFEMASVFRSGIAVRDNFLSRIFGIFAEDVIRMWCEDGPVNGAILLRGSVSDVGRSAVMKEYGFEAVLTVEDAVRDLQAWDSMQLREFVSTRRTWIAELFHGLSGR